MKFITELQLGVHLNGNDGSGERLSVYRHPNGGIFAVDASYIEQNAGEVFDPFTGAEFDPEEAEKVTDVPGQSKQYSESWDS